MAFNIFSNVFRFFLQFVQFVQELCVFFKQKKEPDRLVRLRLSKRDVRKRNGSALSVFSLRSNPPLPEGEVME